MSLRRSTRRPLAARLAVCALVLLLAAEAFSRWGLGLGTPPLYEADPGFEYRLRPDQDLRRFGNHIVVNRWGMRSPDFETTRTGSNELRVLVVGDSVVNGGSQIDQRDLSTTLLQASLQQALGRPVLVGNISAGSWGPGNWLAYARRFGFFEADVVLLVVGSGDHADNPSFQPLGADHPTEPPLFALQEAAQRYLPRYLSAIWRNTSFSPSDAPRRPAGSSAEESARGLADLDEFLKLAMGEGRHVAVLHHPDRNELESGRMLDGHDQMFERVKRLGLPWVALRTVYQAAGPAIYRDEVHHSALGQQVMAVALHQVAIEAVGAPVRPPPRTPAMQP